MKSNKQTEILEFIQYKIENEGYSPSIREIAEKVNLKSTSSVHHHLNNLIEKGLLSKKAKQSRTLTSNKIITSFKTVPIVGEIAAGSPLLAEENKIGEVSVPQEKFNQNLFALKINGDSMLDAGIHDGDIVVIDKGVEPKNGDIGAFMINDTEAVSYTHLTLPTSFLV